MKFYLFADDTNLLYADKNLKSLESTINDELCKLYDWLKANKLSLNIKKSNYVIFRPRQKKVKYEVNLKISIITPTLTRLWNVKVTLNSWACLLMRISPGNIIF